MAILILPLLVLAQLAMLAYAVGYMICGCDDRSCAYAALGCTAVLLVIWILWSMVLWLAGMAQAAVTAVGGTGFVVMGGLALVLLGVAIAIALDLSRQ